MINAFKQAIKSLFANPARTALTTLGIIIGIATVILVLSAGAGFRSLINAQVDALGSNTLFVETRVPPTTKNRNAGAAQADTGRATNAVAITSFKNQLFAWFHIIYAYAEFDKSSKNFTNRFIFLGCNF